MRSIISFVIFCVLLFPNFVNAENSGNKWSFYTGMFDFSDDGKKSNLFGIQHINEDLYRETSFGTLQPVTGAFITADNAKYIYTGFQIPKKNGSFTFTPSFTPGLYDEGDGKDLGSNASLGDKNPGANSYMFNFIKVY